MSDPQFARDLGKKLQVELANAFILIAVQMRKEGVDPSRLYDDLLVALNALMPLLKEEGLGLVATAERKRAGVAA